MSAQDFPHLLKHMALAIYDKGYFSGSKERKISGSIEVAIAKLVDWGYFEHVSLYGPPFKLTARGSKREILHELESPAKSKRFDLLYGLIQEAFEGRSVESVEGRSQSVLKAQAQARKAYAAISGPYLNTRTKNKRKVVRKAAKPKRAVVRRAKRR